MTEIIQFFSWTLLLYWIHRTVHSHPAFLLFHNDHHNYISEHKTGWDVTNLYLINDTVDSTIDLWLTEVIPTFLFAMTFNAWWIMLLYYIWAAFLQEELEHSDLNLYPFTSGKWHMAHHEHPDKNFGLFLPIWDIIFKTEHE